MSLRRVVRAVATPITFYVDRRRVRKLVRLRVMADFYDAQRAWDLAVRDGEKEQEGDTELEAS